MRLRDRIILELVRDGATTDLTLTLTLTLFSFSFSVMISFSFSSSFSSSSEAEAGVEKSGVAHHVVGDAVKVAEKRG